MLINAMTIVDCSIVDFDSTNFSRDPEQAYIPREHWDDYDPQLIAEGLFAAANIFRSNR
jgi:hypothetical protein